MRGVLTPVGGRDDVRADAGNGRVVAGRSARAPAVRDGRGRPAARAARRRPARADHRRVRDVGDAGRRRVQRVARAARAHRRQPRGRRRRARARRDRLVGRAHRSGPGDRHRPVLRGVPQRARRLPGHDRSGVDRPPQTGRPYGSRFPTITIRDQIAVEAMLADALGHRAVGGGGRRVDGRAARARVGGRRTPSASRTR